jgi:uncharacterized membrane protein YcaP (DUF421 family)
MLTIIYCIIAVIVAVVLGAYVEETNAYDDVTMADVLTAAALWPLTIAVLFGTGIAEERVS